MADGRREMDATNGMAGVMKHVQPDLRDGEGTDREGTLGLGSV